MPTTSLRGHADKTNRWLTQTGTREGPTEEAARAPSSVDHPQAAPTVDDASAMDETAHKAGHPRNVTSDLWRCYA